MKHLLWILITFVALLAGCKKTDTVSTAILSTTTIGNITSNSAQGGGNITSNGGSNITKKGLCWATHAGPTVGDSVTSDGVGIGAFTSTLANLNANTTYYARAYAINASGTAYGNVDSFTTAKGLPTVTTTGISNIAPLTAYSGGNVITNGGASLTARGVCWSTSAHPTITSYKTVASSNSTGSLADTLTYLASQTTYYVRAYATNSFGTAYGNEVSFTSSSANTVTDIEGNVYPYVVIGNQTWMASNLRSRHYQNGDTIINGSSTSFDWWTNFVSMAYKGAYTFPNGDSAKNALYGKLYNNYAVDDSRGMCPIGWHVPSRGEWNTLEFYEGVSASDTSVNGTGYGLINTTIGTKLLAGGSSGLNVQFAGIMLINGPGDNIYSSTNNATTAFWGSDIDDGAGIRGNFFIQFFIGQISRSNDFEQALSVRCVKN